jgi:hypothetical protein
MRTLGQLMLLAGIGSVAFGGFIPVPEIDANTETSAIALAAGSLLILRARFRK